MPKPIKRIALLLAVMTALCCAAAEETKARETRIEPERETPAYVEAVLKIARQEIGYTEEKNGATKYGVWSGDPYAEWCAEFLCWCVDQADKRENTQLLNSLYPNYTGTNTGKNWFIRQGRYVARKGRIADWGSQWFIGSDTVMEKNSYIPQPGDWMFFSTSATGDTTHVAMVEYCAYDENGRVLVHVIEGNNPSAVARNVYPVDYWATRGYGTVSDVADVTMKFGNEGEKVRALQQLLVEAELIESQYTTGRFGAITQNAIRNFQRMTGLSQTGIADLTTQKLLKDYAHQKLLENPENWKLGEE